MPVTLAEALERAVRVLDAAGIEAPRRDARLLLGAATGLGIVALVGDSQRPIEDGAAVRFDAFVRRRARREPVSHLLGRREFWGRDFLVGPAVLDPRPDSEALIEAALDILACDAEASVLDLGVGSGCLLLSVLAERARVHGLGVDLSPAAVRIAKENAWRLGLGDRARFFVGDWGAAIGERFDLILCNPPYVAREAISRLAPEIALHEPKLALDGGADGLAAYRAVAGDLARLLRPCGVALIEVGDGQAMEIEEIFRSSGIEVRDWRHDLGGRPRCLVAAPSGDEIG